jgi:hypothetical protein
MTSHSLTMRRHSLYSAAAVCCLAGVPLLSSSAQIAGADSLARRLTAADVHIRAEAVARLNALPLGQLTPSARRSLVRLLELEATGRAPKSSEPTSGEDETYGEYIIDLTSGVLRLQDPASLHGLVRLGIETAQDVQQFVASFGARSLPLLDDAWRTRENARSSIIATWAFATLVRGPNALRPDDRRRVLRSILAATDEYTIAVAGAARSASLTGLIPVLTDVASRLPKNDIGGERATRAANELAPLRARLGPTVLLDDAADWIAAVCGHEEGKGEGKGEGEDDRGRRSGSESRRRACDELAEQLERARTSLRAGRLSEARAALSAATRTAAAARSSRVFTAPEGAVIHGNLQYLLTRLQL